MTDEQTLAESVRFLVAAYKTRTASTERGGEDVEFGLDLLPFGYQASSAREVIQTHLYHVFGPRSGVAITSSYDAQKVGEGKKDWRVSVHVPADRLPILNGLLPPGIVAKPQAPGPVVSLQKSDEAAEGEDARKHESWTLLATCFGGRLRKLQNGCQVQFVIGPEQFAAYHAPEKKAYAPEAARRAVEEALQRVFGDSAKYVSSNEAQAGPRDRLTVVADIAAEGMKELETIKSRVR